MARKAVLPKLILRLLEDTHFLSAKQIINYLHSDGDDFNKSSVYRSLDKLQESGEVCKEIFGESEALYELKQEHHDHAVCNGCAKIIAVECQSRSNKEVKGFKVDNHSTVLYGLCSDCG